MDLNEVTELSDVKTSRITQDDDGTLYLPSRLSLMQYVHETCTAHPKICLCRVVLIKSTQIHQKLPILLDLSQI